MSRKYLDVKNELTQKICNFKMLTPLEVIITNLNVYL